MKRNFIEYIEYQKWNAISEFYKFQTNPLNACNKCWLLAVNQSTEFIWIELKIARIVQLKENSKMSGAKKNRLQTSNRWKNCQFIVIRWMFYTFDLFIINCHSCSANMIILRIGDFHVSSNHLMLSIALVQCMFFTPTFALILNHTVYSVISSNTFVCRQWRIESNRNAVLFSSHCTCTFNFVANYVHVFIHLSPL